MTITTSQHTIARIRSACISGELASMVSGAQAHTISQ